MQIEPAKSQRELLIDPSQPQLTEVQRAAIWQGVFQRDCGAFRVVFDHSSIGMSLVDVDGRFLRVNSAFCRTFGYSEEELQAIDIRTITHSEDIEPGLSLFRRMVCGEIDSFHLEKRCVHKQGDIVWIELCASIVRDEDRRPCYAVGQVQDITSRKMTELASAKRLRNLERLTVFVPRILYMLDDEPSDAFYPGILRIVLECFESKKGLFLRFDEDGGLVGPYIAAGNVSDGSFLPLAGCELWDRALAEKQIVIENKSRLMGCGESVCRSVVAPLVHADTKLGLFHIADANSDYDADDLDLLNRISTIIAPAVLARSKREKLTSREVEVLNRIVSGKTVKQIAAELAIGIQTVAKHRSRILNKIGVSNDVQLVRMAIQMRNPRRAAARAVADA